MTLLLCFMNPTDRSTQSVYYWIFLHLDGIWKFSSSRCPLPWPWRLGERMSEIRLQQ